jgi:acyl-CoA reductase-like NAD-dependent aldehyde dehydrogenase
MSETTETAVEARLLIGGELVAADEHLDVLDPSTGEPVATTPMATAADVDRAVAAAVAAGPAWGADAALRSDVLLRLAAAIGEHAEELATTLSGEIGIPLRDAGGEVMGAAGFLKHRAAAGDAVDVIHDDERQTVRVVRSPVGVVAAIVPWNAPLLIACEKVSSAFAAGDTVVLKPSPLAPLTLLKLAELAAEIVPEGVLSVLPGSDEVGARLTTHPDVAMVSFTGSSATGKAIMAAAAPSLKRLSLELGGNDPAVVLPGSDVQRLAPKLFQAAFYRSGQLCAAVKRIYVHEDDHAALVAGLKAVAEAAVVGAPSTEGVALGPLSNREQRDRVAALVDDAVAAGATAVTGGAPTDGPGFFYPPTIVTDVPEGTALLVEEQFGPALPVVAYSDVDGAVAAANDTPYGLGASVWADDAEAAADVAARIEAGSVWVNRHGIVSPEIPFGGVRESGVGRSNGRVGLDAYCELKTVSVAKPRPRKN